jgi:hypothetical protein
LRPTFGFGSNGSIFFHCSSVNFQRVLAIGLFTSLWLFFHNSFLRNMLNCEIFRL